MKKEPRKDYQITPVRMSPEVKTRMRIIAAENGTSMSDMAGKFMLKGLEIYEESLKAKKQKTA